MKWSRPLQLVYAPVSSFLWANCDLKDVSKGKANSGNLKCQAAHTEEVPTYS